MNTSPCTVFVVDDSPIARRIARSLLQRVGHPVEEFESGPAALEACRCHLPELMLIDGTMPEMSGVELARRMREEHGDRCPQLVFVSAEESPERIQEALNAGMGAILRKPYSPQELLGVVRGSTSPQG